MFRVNLPGLAEVVEAAADTPESVRRRLLRGGTSNCISPEVFVTYKALVAVYLLFWCLWWPVKEDEQVYLFITYWTFYLATMYFIASGTSAYLCLQAIEAEYPAPQVPHANMAPREPREPVKITRSPVPLALRWVQNWTWNISCVSSLVVTFMFWVALYDGGPVTSIDVNAHGVVAGLMILDQLLISSEYKCRSAFWQTEYYAVVYLIFNLIWYYEGPLESRVLYTILDWEDDGGMATLFIFLIFFILVPIFSTMHYGVYRLREWIYYSCCNRLYPIQPFPAQSSSGLSRSNSAVMSQGHQGRQTQPQQGNQLRQQGNKLQQGSQAQQKQPQGGKKGKQQGHQIHQDTQQQDYPGQQQQGDQKGKQQGRQMHQDTPQQDYPGQQQQQGQNGNQQGHQMYQDTHQQGYPGQQLQGQMGNQQGYQTDQHGFQMQYQQGQHPQHNGGGGGPGGVFGGGKKGNKQGKKQQQQQQFGQMPMPMGMGFENV